MKSGTLFDNVLITDDPEYAKQLAEETWGKQKDVSWYISSVRKASPVSNILIVQLFDTVLRLMQAEKAAFEEAEKQREEEVWA